jgi:hypothetical protein
LMFPSNLLPEQYQSKYYVMYFKYYLVLKTWRYSFVLSHKTI